MWSNYHIVWMIPLKQMIVFDTTVIYAVYTLLYAFLMLSLIGFK